MGYRRGFRIHRQLCSNEAARRDERISRPDASIRLYKLTMDESLVGHPIFSLHASRPVTRGFAGSCELGADFTRKTSWGERRTLDRLAKFICTMPASPPNLLGAS